MVYLLHFERRYWHAGHYLGWTQDLPGRMRAHRAGDGARLMEVINEHGIRWVVSRVWWDGDRTLERALKA
ncbi:hypothetical protein KSC_086670 [Ktedonobacter sp. SOSP1-52]|uniref:hypothetical protein n=1 Tax=Ktedonobacter sp. SOSP1-52 TaxID=2778366 RepID=UPI001914E8E7|nr:hypothetical protein [Ktedonobacter sp. SOSP1-52]GHO69775.1 hypothetical protein KSC_086670 [Ktedonobacter sp. SOSP1-52]